jgi:hypothetical protein
MLLWTWQNTAFNLADRTLRVDSLKNSVYTTHRSLDTERKGRHERAYKMVFERLGTDQLIWCFHRYEDAVDSASISEFETLGCVLWEVDVPPERIKWHCHGAWTCLRAGKPDLPERMHRIYRELSLLEPDYARNFEDNFITYWEEKTDAELLDLVFLRHPEDGCSGPIVFHPIDTIVKNPLLLGKWWGQRRWGDTGLRRRDDPVELPCRNCPARNA